MQRFLSRGIVMMCFATMLLSQFAAAQTAQQTQRRTPQARVRPPRPIAVEDGKVVLTPQNSTIQFVGTHIGEKPDPRTGYFTKFTGELLIDEATKGLGGAVLEIETGSLVTPIGRLTGHLQSPDFFDVRQYPKATFESKKVEATDAARGEFKITGDLTLREVTKPVSIPVKVKVTDAGAVLTSEFKLKRSEFGMTFGPDRVEDEVAMNVTVGRPTPKVTPQ